MDFSLCACRWAVRKTVLCWVSELFSPRTRDGHTLQMALAARLKVDDEGLAFGGKGIAVLT